MKLLENIGMTSENIVEKKWLKMYNLAKIYYEHHGNLEIVQTFKTKNGYEFDENGLSLGNWIFAQRYSYKSNDGKLLLNDSVELLNQIGMRWDNLNAMDSWMENYNLAKTYYEHYGNLNMPYNFKTKNGYEFDENGIALGKWIGSQRGLFNGTRRGEISDEQIKLLENIGMLFNLRDENWLKMYNMAKIYYEHHGNLKTPATFKTKNGYEFDKNGVALGSWICTQRTVYKGTSGHKKMSAEKIKLLEEIGMIWFEDKLNQKLQQEQITAENLERKKLEIQNKFYSVLNNYDDDTLPSREELNEKFLDQINTSRKM